MPITWRNIEAPTMSGAAGMLEVTRRSFNDGVKALRGSFDEYGEQIQTQWDQGKEANTQAFLDKLAQYKTPEELAAAQAAGEIQAFRQQFGNKIDAATVRDAEAGLQQKLIERIAAQNQFADDTFNRNARPLMDEYQGYLARQDTAGAAKFLADNQLAVDESGALKDLQDLQKTLFSQKIDQGQLAVSQGNLQINRNQDLRAGELHDLKVADYWKGKNGDASAQEAVLAAGSVEEARKNLGDQLRQGNLDLTQYTQHSKNLDTLEKEASKLTSKQQAGVTNLTLNQAAEQSGDPDFWNSLGAQIGLTTPAEIEGFRKKYGSGKLSNWKAATEREAEENSSLLTKHKNVTEGNAYQKLFKETPEERDETADNVRRAVQEFRQDQTNKVPSGMDMGVVLAEVADRYGVDDKDWWDDQISSGKFKGILQEVFQEYNRQIGAKKKAIMAGQLVDSLTARETTALQVQNLKNNLFRK